MVYETETLRLCHELSPQSKELWQKMLEQMADEILFKHKHPILYKIQRIKERIKELI